MQVDYQMLGARHFFQDTFAVRTAKHISAGAELRSMPTVNLEQLVYLSKILGLFVFGLGEGGGQGVSEGVTHGLRGLVLAPGFVLGLGWQT